MKPSPGLRHPLLMAQRVITEMVDDLDGSIIAEGENPTVKFGLDGVAYEIDLSGDNRAALNAALAPYIAKARRASGPRREKPAGKRSKEQTAAIRKWAIDSGYQLSDRGRIPAPIEARFHEVGGVPLQGDDRPQSA